MVKSYVQSNNVAQDSSLLRARDLDCAADGLPTQMANFPERTGRKEFQVGPGVEIGAGGAGAVTFRCVVNSNDER